MGAIPKLLDGNKAEKYQALTANFLLSNADVTIGPLLLIHWRNKIVHPKSNASLTKEQANYFSDSAEFLRENYKGLDPMITLQNFKASKPSLKDTSSLIAMTINSVKSIDTMIPEPKSSDELVNWLRHLGLLDGLRKAQKKPSRDSDIALQNFFTTNCPQLMQALKDYGV